MNSMPHYEVVIVGGGIYGAGVAQAAAAAGYRVLLLEKNDWGTGTSSKSSKLIHGGLRYLQSGQFKLVYECLYERALLLKNAPDLVKLNRFYIPVYRDSHYRPWQIRLGLSLYSLLTGFAPSGRFTSLKPAQWQELPGLNEQGLEAVFQYYDGQTDDRLLTEAVVHSARSLGATTLTRAQFQAAHSNSDGYQVSYQYQGELQEVTAGVLVNAAGPWARTLSQHILPQPFTPEVELVQGTHLVVKEQWCEHCFYLESPDDQRAIFVLPWQGATLIGTTERPLQGNPDDCAPSDAETDYLLKAVQHYFPEQPLTVQERFAGLRVLPKLPGKAFSRPRETQLITDQPTSPHYIGLFGGKLTSYRAESHKVLKLIQQTLGANTRKVHTRHLPLILTTD